MSWVIVLCIFIVNMVILKTVKTNSLYLAIVPTKLVQLTYYLFFLTLIFSNTVATIGSIYSARNMDLLLTTPVSPLRLYFAKVFEILFESSSMLFIFAIPTSVAFCWSLGLPLKFFFIVVMASLPLLVIPIGISVLLGTLFVRFASIVWRRGSFLFLAILGVVVWAVSSIGSTLLNVQQGEGSLQIIKLIALFDNPNPAWLPSRWTADLIAEVLGNPLSHSWLNWILLFGTAAGSLAIGYITYDLLGLSTRSYALSNASETQKNVDAVSKPDPVRRGLDFFFGLLPITQQSRSIILKDLSSLLRDRSQSFQLLMFVAISVVYVTVFKFMVVSMNMAATAALLWKATLASFNILFTGFILTAVMTRLIYPSVSLEGRSFWILQTSPMDLPKLIGAKFLCWFPMALFIAQFLLLSGGWALGMEIPELVNASFIGVCLAFGCTGLAIGMGASFSSFEWESPNQLSTGLGTLALFGASLLMVCLITIPGAFGTTILAVPPLQKKFGAISCLAILVISQLLIIGTAYFANKIARKRGAKALKEKVLR